MSKGLHNLFNDGVNKLNQSFPTLVESGSEVFHFITEPSNVSEVTILPEDFKKAWLKATLKEN